MLKLTPFTAISFVAAMPLSLISTLVPLSDASLWMKVAMLTIL